MPITQQFSDETVRIGTSGSIVVTCYRSTPTLASLEVMDRIESELLKTVPTVALIAIAGERASMLRIDEKVRNRSAEMSQKFKGCVRGAAVVIVAKGLSAVMARSFMTAFLLLSKQSWPIHTFSTVGPAATWINGLPGGDTTVSLAELEAFDRGE